MRGDDIFNYPGSSIHICYSSSIPLGIDMLPLSIDVLQVVPLSNGMPIPLCVDMISLNTDMLHAVEYQHATVGACYGGGGGK